MKVDGKDYWYVVLWGSLCPVSWQGLVQTFCYGAIFAALLLGAFEHYPPPLNFHPAVYIVLAVLVFIRYLRVAHEKAKRL